MANEAANRYAFYEDYLAKRCFSVNEIRGLYGLPPQPELTYREKAALRRLAGIRPLRAER